MKNNKNYDIQVLRDIYSTIKPAIGIEAISVKKIIGTQKIHDYTKANLVEYLIYQKT